MAQRARRLPAVLGIEPLALRQRSADLRQRLRVPLQADAARTRAQRIQPGPREIAMEHPDTKRHLAGVGQGCVRIDDVVTPTSVGLGADDFRTGFDASALAPVS
jgi:hypothetical protein